MTLPERMLVVGQLGVQEEKAVQVVARELGLSLEVTATALDALRLLEDGPFDLVLCDLTLDGANRVLTRARCRRGERAAPVFAMARFISDIRFTRAFQWGADDLVLWRNTSELITRIRSLPRAPEHPKAPSRGEALIADPNARRCELYGSVLASAGYDVRYAVDLMTLEYYMAKPTMVLVVMTSAFSTAKDLIQRAREAGNQALFVVTEKSSRLKKCVDGLRGMRSVVAMDAHCPPDNILFVANEADARKRPNSRTERRLIYGRTVTFRESGKDTDDFGFCYTASEHGIFVRTLRVPREDRIWLDVRPPGSDRVVRLEARVTWRCSMGDGSNRTSPPGFAAMLTGGLGDDLNTWGGAVQAATDLVESGNPIWIDSMPPPPARQDEALRELIRASLDEMEEAELFDRDSTVDGSIMELAMAVKPAQSAEGCAAPATVETLETAPHPATPEATPPPVVGSPQSVSGTATTPPARGTGRAVQAPPARRYRRQVAVGAALGAVAVAFAFTPGVAALSGYRTPALPAQRASIPPKDAPSPPLPLQAPPPARSLVLEARAEAAPAPVAPTPAATVPVAQPPLVRGAANELHPAEASPELEQLQPTQGYLRVNGPESIPVSVHGVQSGTTNQWLVVRCGARFVRLGTPARWLDAGKMELVPCGHASTLRRTL